MLYSKLQDFATINCPEKDIEPLTLAVFRYILRLSSSKELSRVAKVNYDLGSEVQVFKKDFLDSTSYTLSRLWRGIYLAVRSQTCDVASIAATFELDSYDIEVALKLLSNDDITKIKNMPPYREYPCDDELKNMITGMKPYAQYLKYKYLNFVEKYYPEWGVDTNANGTQSTDSPLVNDLLMEGYRIALKYDYKVELGNIKTICLTWMHNYAVNLIKKCNAKSRQNIVRTYRRFSRKRGMEQEFATTITSLDEPRDNENGSCVLHNFVSTENATLDFDTTRFIRQLKYHSHSKKCHRFIDIIVGRKDDIFEAWLAEKGVVYDKLSPEKLATYAQEFLRLSDVKLKNRVGNLLKQEMEGSLCNNY